MIQVKYTVGATPTVAEGFFINADVKDSQFFIKKEEGLITLVTKFSDKIDFSSQIYSVTKTNSRYKVYSNTEDLLFTNIVIDDIPYYYKLICIGDSLDYKTLVLNSDIESVSKGGVLFTNEEVHNREIIPGVFVHSEPVISKSSVSIKYRAKDIETTLNSSLGELHVKCRKDVVVTPRLLNDSKINVPSFYLSVNNKVLKCIEGDIKLVKKEELVTFVGNSLQCKDLIHEYNGNYFNSYSNKIYVPFYNYETTTAVVNYVAKQSSHTYLFNEKELYFKVTKQGLVLTTSVDYDFSVAKKVDYKKLTVIPSRYLTTYKSVLDPSKYVMVKDFITDANEAVGLVQQVITTPTKFPSQVAYIKHNERYILQHNNAILPTIHNDLVEEDIYSDRETNPFRPISGIYDGYSFVKIKDTYLYRKGVRDEVVIEPIEEANDIDFSYTVIGT